MKTLAMTTVMVLGLCCATAAAALEIYLPRQARVEGEALTLGDLAAVNGEDAELKARAEAVTLGRAPFSGETLTISRTTILSRLAASGISSRRVRLTGADRIDVNRSESRIAHDVLASQAHKLLEHLRPRGPQAVYESIAGTDLLVSAIAEPRFRARLMDEAPPGAVRVEVEVLDSGQRPVGAATVTFRVGYTAQQAVSLRDIAPGAMITAGDFRVETVVQSTPQVEFLSPEGQLATSLIRAGTVIRPLGVRSPAAPVRVTRNQQIVMRIQAETFSLTALGQALEDGRTGQHIRVRNVDTGRVVTARVGDDGAVYPVFQENR